MRADAVAPGDSSTARVRGDKSPPSTASAHVPSAPPALGHVDRGGVRAVDARLWAKFSRAISAPAFIQETARSG